MKRLKVTAAWLVGVFLAIAWTWAGAQESGPFLGMITGDVNSTAYHIGEDIRTLAASDGIDLALYHSRGDIENIVAVYQRPGNHLGLVAADVLAFVAMVEDAPRLKLIANKVKWLLPLYDREVHVLAGQPIKTLEDLKGRRVAVGHAESGSYLTSRLLLEIAGVKPLELVAMDGGRALAALRDGGIDALITVDGAPVEWLRFWVSSADGLHLVPIAEDRIRAFYPAIRIPAGTYPWQAGGVETISVKSVMVTYDFGDPHCQAIGRLPGLIRENLGWLRQHGHPKWNTVDVSHPVKGWEPYACVVKDRSDAHAAAGLRLPDKPSNPVVDAVHAVFAP